MNSGNIGYCKKLGHTTGIILTWNKTRDEILENDCGHENCPFLKNCKLYQENHVGKSVVYPLRDENK